MINYKKITSSDDIHINIKPEVLPYWPTAGRSILNDKEIYIFFVWTFQPVIEEFIAWLEFSERARESLSECKLMENPAKNVIIYRFRSYGKFPKIYRQFSKHN